jgi:hypothetical protein
MRGMRMRGMRMAVLGAALLGALALATPAAADEYSSETAGHPLRILAYVLHPVGVALDYLVMRPAHWVGSQEPFQTIFGHTDQRHY